MSLKVYIFLRADLPDFKQGALVAQACHSTFLMFEKYKDLPAIQEYLKQEFNMTKVVLKMYEKDIKNIEFELDKLGLKYVVWKEQPEDIITSLCTIPIEIDQNIAVKNFLKCFKLF